jgi:hypothetical protein
MATVKVSDVTDTVFDLDTFAEVTLVKECPDFNEVESWEEALQRLGNDSKRALAAINRGLIADYRQQIADNPELPWHTFTDEGEKNGEFAGTPAEPKAVNSLVLTLAKTVFGYSKDMAKEVKKAAKESAMEMIRTTDAIKAGLRKSAAKKASA